jgi:hypothetical protein
MRTAVSKAPSVRHLHWQAAFTAKAYQASSPVFRLKLVFELAAEKKAAWKAKALHPQKGPPDLSRRDGISPHFHLLSPSPPN